MREMTRNSDHLPTKERDAPYPLPLAVTLTLLAGVAGLPTGILRFPSYASSLAGIGWKAATVVVMLAAVRVFEKRRATLADTGIVPVRATPARHRGRVAIPVAVAMVALTAAWSAIPGLRNLDASGSAASYDAGMLTTGLLLFELLVRYPIGVLTEEAFFRGFLQPRIAAAAPVVSGVLFALYHLQQWQTIPSLIPYGIALGMLRWWLNSIWPGVGLHYAGNALFILSLYAR